MSVYVTTRSDTTNICFLFLLQRRPYSHSSSVGYPVAHFCLASHFSKNDSMKRYRNVTICQKVTTKIQCPKFNQNRSVRKPSLSEDRFRKVRSSTIVSLVRTDSRPLQKKYKGRIWYREKKDLPSSLDTFQDFLWDEHLPSLSDRFDFATRSVPRVRSRQVLDFAQDFLQQKCVCVSLSYHTSISYTLSSFISLWICMK